MRLDKRSRHGTANPSAMRMVCGNSGRRHRKTCQKIGVRNKAGRGSAGNGGLYIPGIPEPTVNVPEIPRTMRHRERRYRQTSRAKRRRTDRTIRPSVPSHGGNHRLRQPHEHGVPMMIPQLHCRRSPSDGTSGESRCTATANSICRPMSGRASKTRNSRSARPSHIRHIK